MTGESGGSVRRRYLNVVAPSMRDVLRQPLPPKSVFQWLEEGLRNPQDQRIFLLCCMYFLQMRAVRRMTTNDVVQATTWTKTTSRVSSDDSTHNSHVSYEQTKIISVKANATQSSVPGAVVAYDAENVKFPEGQQFWERMTRNERELRKPQRKVSKLRGRSRERREVNMVHVQCEANFCHNPEYDRIGKPEEDSEESECYQALSGKKPSNGKLARLRRSLVKLFRKDSDKLSRNFSSKKIDDLLSVRTNKLRSRDAAEGKRTVVVKRQYSNVLNVEPRVSLNYLSLFEERGRRNVSQDSNVLYKNDNFNSYEVSDLNVVRSRTVVSVVQQHQQTDKQQHKSSALEIRASSNGDMESDIREALEAFEDAYLSDPGPTPCRSILNAATVLTPQPQHPKPKDEWKPLFDTAKSAPYARFRDIPSPPSLDWQPRDLNAMFMKNS